MVQGFESSVSTPSGILPLSRSQLPNLTNSTTNLGENIQVYESISYSKHHKVANSDGLSESEIQCYQLDQHGEKDFST